MEKRVIENIERENKAKILVAKETIKTGKNKQFIEESSDKDGACKILNIEPDIYSKIIEEEKEKFNPKTFKVFGRQGQAQVFFQEQPFFYDKGSLWWFWNKDDYKWEIVDEIDILNIIEETKGVDIISSKSRNEILNSLKQEGRKRIPKSIKPTWIQFKDQIIDIITGEKFKATPEYFVANPIPYKFHKDKYEDTPVMDRIFEEWVGKENIKTLYEILAFSLLPDYPINRIFCFVGAGMNGKSCFLNLLKKFVGVNNCTSTELDILVASRFEITKLHKKLVCIMGETNFNELSRTSILKKLTGGDLIGFEYKNKTPFDEKNYAKIIIATNNLPTTTDKTIGFYRRWMIIDFPNQFSEKKDILNDIPEEEYESLALKCCMILREILINRNFTNEGSIEERTKRYEEKSNPFDKFVREYCDSEDPDGFIFKFEFEKKFNDWCRENRFRQFSETAIGLKMKDKHIITGRKQSTWLIDGQNKTLRTWEGIKWKE